MLAVLALLLVSALQQVVLAKPVLPISSWPYEKFYSEANHIPSCVSSDSCAIYVDSANGNDADNDGTKDKPYKSVTKALADITESKDTIVVAEGKYDGNSGENFPWNLTSDVKILGGFYDSFAKRNNSRSANKSTISLIAIGSSPELETGVQIFGSDAVIDGFEFIDGNLNAGANQESGGAIQYEGDNQVAITNNTFKNNKASKGGAISAKGTVDGDYQMVIANNIFDSNEATTLTGGAIYASGGTLIIGNTVKSNKSPEEGGGIYATGDTEIVGNLIYDNNKNLSGSKGGGVAADGQVKIYNNYVLGNGKDSGLYVTGKADVVHNTVIGNSGHGIQVGSNDVDVVNNLSAYNVNKGYSPLVVSLTNYKSENNADFGNGAVSKMVTECDPKIADKGSRDPANLKLGAGSECIDIGQNYGGGNSITALMTDYFGTKRNLDGNKDGAFGTDPGAHEIEGDEPGEVTKPTITNIKIEGDRDPAWITFDLDADASVTIEIKDEKGNVINKFVDKDAAKKGSLKYEWDQHNDDEEKVDYGKYKAVIAVENEGGKIEEEKEFELVKADPNKANEVVEATTEETKEQEAEKEEPKTTTTTTTPTNFEKCSGFTDVLKDSQLCDSISWVKEKGIFAGYEDGTFGYSRPISRAEALKVIFVYFDQQMLDDDGTTLGFSDVIAKAWYMSYIRTAKEFKIVQGYEDGTFKPDRAVSRNEFLKIFFVSSGKEFSDAVTSAPYADVPADATTDWYIKFAKFVSDNTLMDVDKAGNFVPAAPMTRGDVAEFIYRFDQKGLK